MLFRPIQWQVLAEPRKRELRWLPALENRFDKVRGEKGTAEEPPHIARRHAVFPGERPQ